MIKDHELIIHNVFNKAVEKAVNDLEERLRYVSERIKEGKGTEQYFNYLRKQEKDLIQALEEARDYCKIIDEMYWSDHWDYAKQKSKPKEEKVSAESEEAKHEPKRKK